MKFTQEEIFNEAMEALNERFEKHSEQIRLLNEAYEKGAISREIFEIQSEQIRLLDELYEKVAMFYAKKTSSKEYDSKEELIKKIKQLLSIN